jgi:hypothetical protein
MEVGAAASKGKGHRDGCRRLIGAPRTIKRELRGRQPSKEYLAGRMAQEQLIGVLLNFSAVGSCCDPDWCAPMKGIVRLTLAL